MLSAPQIEKIKKQIIRQIESNFPEDKKNFAIKQIEEMDEDQLKQFLIQNNLIKTEENKNSEQCIFCSIISGAIKSYKILENKKAVAVLEINPISYGHILIIPKNHISNSEEMPEETYQLAEKIAEKIKSKLKPKDITIASANLMGHEVINVLPIYENETLESSRKSAKEEELERLREELSKEDIKIEKKEIELDKEKVEEINEKNTWLPRRIP